MKPSAKIAAALKRRILRLNDRYAAAKAGGFEAAFQRRARSLSIAYLAHRAS